MKKSNVTQVTTFEKLLGFCNTQGAMYNPPKDSLKVTALNSLLTSAQQSVQAVNHATTAYYKAVGERSQAFEQLPKFMTRLLNALKAANASETTIKEVSRYKKRFSAQLKSRPAKGTTDDAANGDPPAIKSSRVQSAYDHQLENFEMITQHIASEVSYASTDPNLTVEGIGRYLDNLREKNKAVRDTFATLSAERKNRDKVLFSKQGIFAIARSVKYYIKSILGTQHAIAKEIAGMRFFGKKEALG